MKMRSKPICWSTHNHTPYNWFEKWARTPKFKIYRTGWPDYAIETPEGELIFFEIKSGQSPTKRLLTKEQRRIKDLFSRHGLKYNVWSNNKYTSATKNRHQSVSCIFESGKVLRKGWITALTKI